MPRTSGMLSGIRSSRVATRSAGTRAERLCGHGRAVALDVLAESDARAGLGQDHGSVASTRLRSRSCIIDEEAVACDDNGVASFALIAGNLGWRLVRSKLIHQSRRRGSAKLADAGPAHAARAYTDDRVTLRQGADVLLPDQVLVQGNLI
jgi:hypothetical protein